MTSRRIKVRLLAAEWGPEIAVEPMALARAFFEAAFAGEFEDLPPANRLSIWDEKKLVHLPVESGGGKSRYTAAYVGLMIRSGFAWIEKEAVARFAATREFPLPKSWANLTSDDDVSGIARSEGGARRKAVVHALLQLYPDGPTDYRPAMVRRLKDQLGYTVSDSTLDRAKKVAWPDPSKFVRSRQTSH